MHIQLYMRACDLHSNYIYQPCTNSLMLVRIYLEISIVLFMSVHENERKKNNCWKGLVGNRDFVVTFTTFNSITNIIQ